MPFTKGHKSGMTGKKHSLITKEKQRLTKLGNKNHMWNGGKCIRHGYIYLLRPNHPYRNACGYVAKHRLVMEKFLGFYLSRNIHIHHINENKLDNRLHNLQLVTPREHMNIHRDKINKSKLKEKR